MRIINVEQGSPEWLEARLGVVTGTRVKDALGSSSLKLIDVMIAEKLSNQAKEMRISEEMQRGIDEEPQAAKEYQKETGIKTEIVGFCLHQTLDWLGLSPDRLVREGDVFRGGVEIKAPGSAKHVEYIRINRIPAEYKGQVIDYFLVCETLQWLDFVSWDPRILIKPLHIVRVTREELKQEIDEAMEKLKAFNSRFEEYYEKLTF